MALVDKARAPGPIRVRLLPTLFASSGAVVVFVFVLAFVARATADGVTMPPREDPVVVDAGSVAVIDAGAIVDAGNVDAGDIDAGSVDAGSEVVDAGELYTVSQDAGPDVDGGPAEVEGPPYEPADVAARAVVLVEACAKDALRWDPSLGGTFLLRVTLPEAGTKQVPVIVADGLRSPVLSACVKRKQGSVLWPSNAITLPVRQQVVASATLTTDGRIKIGSVEVRAVDVPPG